MAILTKDNLLAFAHSKPQDETFNYVSNVDCAIAQFLKANSNRPVSVGPLDYTYKGMRSTIPEEIVNVFGLDPVSVMSWGTLADCLENNTEVPQCVRK